LSSARKGVSILAWGQVVQVFARTGPLARRVGAPGQLATFSHRAWDGSGSQHDLLLRDQCILVDGQDIILGSASKRDAHRFDSEQPEGLLHRAFSVFLFDRDQRLLLQQRAAGKVTFPNVWTNTCCSHPLHGQEQNEVDSHADIQSGDAMGVKHAAVRKLRHELGIAPEQLPLDKFRWLTRLHYCAADPSHEGKPEQWGEHEVDHILFIQADVDVAANPEEVQQHKYVSAPELRRMMHPESGLQWSPWFRIIATKFLDPWWAELQKTLTTTRHVDTATVHKINT